MLRFVLGRGRTRRPRLRQLDTSGTRYGYAISPLRITCIFTFCFFFFQAEDGIRDYKVTGVQTCALPISQRIQWTGPSPIAQSEIEAVIAKIRTERTSFRT